MKNLLTKIGGIAALSVAMLGVENKTEAHNPHMIYPPAPIISQHEHIGPLGGIWTHTDLIYPGCPTRVLKGPTTYTRPPTCKPAPIFIQIQPILHCNPCVRPVYVVPAPAPKPDCNCHHPRTF